MPRDLDMIEVVHGRAADPPVIPLETHWLDQVDSRSEAGAEPKDSPDIPGDLRLE